MAGFLSLPFITAYDPKGLNLAQKQLRDLGTSVRNFAKGVITAFGGVSATQASVNFIRDAVTQSRDLERQTAALESVFGKTSKEMLQFSKNGVSMGLSTTAAAKASTFLGSVLKSSGFNMQDTITNTQKLVGLASDLATTYGYDVSEALTGMTALFRGEYDPIEKFGVAMKQAEINTLMHARKLDGLTGQEKLHAQQLIRLELLMKRTTDAQGAFTRQGDSLFVQQAKLSALWENMQATVGGQLTPALTRFLEKLRPIVENFAPNLERIFSSFGSMITNLIPKLDEMSTKVARFFDIVSSTFSGANGFLSGFLNFVLDNIEGIITLIAVFKSLKGVITIVTTAMETYRVATLVATGATAGLTVAQLAMPLGALALAISAIAGVLVIYATNADLASSMQDKLNKKMLEAGDAAVKANPGLQKFLKTQLAIQGMGATDETKKWLFGKTQADAAAALLGVDKGGNGAGAGGTASRVKTFFQDLTEEIKKEALRIKLSKLGASEGLIDAVLGSSTWEASANKIISGGTKTVDFVQRQFNKTKAGLEEIQKAADEAAKALDAYNAKLQDMADFSTEIGDILKGLTSSGMADSLGIFEQSVVSTFESVVSRVNDAVKNDLVKEEDAKNLLAYASASETAMRAIAKERDILAERINSIRDLISTTKTAVSGYVNITSLIENTTKTITESVVSVSNGIRLTLTRSMDVTSISGNIADKFKAILERTKQFALNLRELKRLGLDQNLFKQIVDAGLDAGGATAAAIIEGGGATVTELNSLFADLQATGSDIAETTAQVMFGAGEDSTQGLIDGLLSKQDELKKAAEYLAASFTETFRSMIGNLVPQMPILPDVPIDTGELNPELWGIGGGGGRPAFTTASVGSPTIFNTTVNAGMGTDPAVLEETVVNAMLRYQRRNGAVWQMV